MLIDRVPVARAAVADLAEVTASALMLALVGGALGWIHLVRPRLSQRAERSEIELAEFAPLGDAGVRALLEDALALRDIEIVYAREDGWVDARGRVYEPPPTRRLTEVHAGGKPIAAIVHRPEVPQDSLDLAAGLVGGQLQAQRAAALARARAEEVRAATGALVRAGDRAAARVARELMDGPLPELIDVANRVRSGDTDVRADLQRITATVRTISHGLFPRELEDGLAAVLPPSRVPDHRLPAAIEVTCYLLAADDPDAVIRADGHEASVTCSRAPDPRVLERVRILGGTMRGTVVTVPIGEA
jgi:hypothetical protein